jgi:hypothetical protein
MLDKLKEILEDLRKKRFTGIAIIFFNSGGIVSIKKYKKEA